jgi:XXXCH domain-containing protein
MSRSFRKIVDKLQEGELPKKETVASFCADTEVMLLSLDRGEEHVEAFRKDAMALLAAVEKQDKEAAVASAGNLNQMRKECHARYK